MPDGNLSPEQHGPVEHDPVLDGLFGLRDAGAWVVLARDAQSSSAPLGTLGSYELLEEIGSGGQGRVYKARQHGTNRIVAIKQLAGAMLTGLSGIKRLSSEVEVLLRLSHPNVVTVLGAELIEGRPVLVMEWIEGSTIDRWADGAGGEARPAIGSVLHAFVEVCKGVAHAHHHGVIHRDLKPANIMVGPDERPRVLDFGIAHLRDHWQKAGPRLTNSFVGTTGYCAPEQLVGTAGRTDNRSDVFSLGATLFRLLSGREAFDDPTPAVTLEAIAAGRVPRVSQYRKGVPRELDWIILRALDPDPTLRYQSADALGNDVRRFLEGHPLEARQGDFLYTVRKLVTRHRLAAGVSAFALIAVLAFGVVSGVLAARLDRQRGDLDAALNGERQARLKADALASNRQRVVELFESMISSVHAASEATVAGGPRQILDHLAARLDAGELVDQPEVNVHMHTTVARAYTDLGYDEIASGYIDRGLALARSTFGHDHETVAILLMQRGVALDRQGKFDEAAAVLTETVSIAERIGGSESELMGRALNLLGDEEYSRQRYEEAERFLRRALSIRQRTAGRESHEAGITTRNLALVVAARGHHEQALVTLHEAVRILTQADGPESIAALFAQSHVSGILEQQGLVEEAVASLRAVMGRLEKVAGPRSFGTSAMCERLSLLLSKLGRHAEALDEARRYVDIQRERFRGPHVLVATGLSRIGEELVFLGREVEGVVALGDAVAMLTELGPSYIKQRDAAAFLLHDALATRPFGVRNDRPP